MRKTEPPEEVLWRRAERVFHCPVTRDVLYINEIDLRHSSVIIMCKWRVNMITADTLHPQYLKTKEGKSSFVVLPVQEFESLVEDYNDLTVINQRREEPKISLAELKASLKHV